MDPLHQPTSKPGPTNIFSKKVIELNLGKEIFLSIFKGPVLKVNNSHSPLSVGLL